MAGKGKPCGNSFISADKQCKVGISFNPGEGVADVVGKAKKKGVNAAKIKELADSIREKHGVKQLRGEALNSLHRRVNEVLEQRAGIPVDGRTNKELAAEKKKLDKEQKKLQAELDRLVAIRDGRAPAAAPAAVPPVGRRVVLGKTADLQNMYNRLQVEKERALNVDDFDKAKKIADNQRKIQKELDNRRNGGPRDAVVLEKASRVPAPPPKKVPGVNRPFASQNDDQLKGKMEAAWALGKDADYRAMREEYKRRIAKDELKKKEFAIDEAIRAGKQAKQQALMDKDMPAFKAAQDMIKSLEERKRQVGTSGLPQNMRESDKTRLKNIDSAVESNTTKSLGGDYNWRDSRSNPDSKVLGAGAYGVAVRDSSKNVVKRGDIGPNEGDIIKRVGELDLGPRLIAAQLDGEGNMSGTKKGRVAMTLVPGSPIGNKDGKEGAYWTARAALHRAGIAHNDMHIENVMVDRKGKGRFVDMGLAQDNPKAALAEAMGMFDRVPNGTSRNGGEGDWQVKRWRNIGGRQIRTLESDTANRFDKADAERRFPTLARVVANKEAAVNKLRSYGLSDRDIATVMTHGIRQSDASYNRGTWAKLTDQQALNVINTLYQGI